MTVDRLPADEPVRYLSAEKMSQDDFGIQFTNQCGEVIYDAATRYGPWATMTKASYQSHARQPGQLGIGYGHKYTRNEAGELELTEGDE